MNEEFVKKTIAAFTAQIAVLQGLVTDFEKLLPAGAAEEPPKKRGGRKAKEEQAPLSQEELDRVVIEHPCGCKITKDTALSFYCDEHKKNMQAAAAAKVAEGNTGPVPPALVEAPKADAPPAPGAVLVKDVTIEMLRERSVQYSATPPKGFGMEAWCALIQRVLHLKAGEKASIKGIPPEMYGAVWAAMGDDLAKMEGAPPASVKPTTAADAGIGEKPAVSPEQKPAVSPAQEITIDQLKAEAKKFIDRNGQPAFVAVLKVFGAVKISEMDPAKRGALLEAISNA